MTQRIRKVHSPDLVRPAPGERDHQRGGGEDRQLVPQHGRERAARKRGQPAAPGSQGVLRGPVSQPVRKLISTQPQTSRAQVKAR